jgi:hypothetical protein
MSYQTLRRNSAILAHGTLGRPSYGKYHPGGGRGTDLVGRGPITTSAQAARALAARAKQAERQLTPVVTGAVAKAGGTMDKLQYRLKAENPDKPGEGIKRLEEKIDLTMRKDGVSAAEAADSIADAVRYTAVFPDERYPQGITSTLDALRAEGASVYDKKDKNFWKKGDPYQGFNVTAVASNGQKFEVQFHTPRSLAVANTNHPLYQLARKPTTTAPVRQHLTMLMTASSATVPVPPGIENIGTPTSA